MPSEADTDQQHGHVRFLIFIIVPLYMITFGVLAYLGILPSALITLFAYAPCVLLAFGLQRRVKSKGALFTGRPTWAKQALALVIGGIFGVFGILMMFLGSSSVGWFFIGLTVLLLLYALGLNSTRLRKRQGDQVDR